MSYMGRNAIRQISSPQFVPHHTAPQKLKAMHNIAVFLFSRRSAGKIYKDVSMNVVVRSSLEPGPTLPYLNPKQLTSTQLGL